MAALFAVFADLLRQWGMLFVSPFTNTHLLWIIVPIYLNFLFTEFFQEKKGTPFGNAISNGMIVIWVGVDWSRTLFEVLTSKEIPIDILFFTKMFIAALLIVYGLWIVVSGIKVKKVSKHIGRIRQVTYVCLMFTPIMYGVVPISFSSIFAIIIFFPLFYYFIEAVDYILPDPKTFAEESGNAHLDFLAELSHSGSKKWFQFWK